MAHMQTCLSDEEFVDLLGIWRGAEWWPQSLTDRLLLEAEKRGYDTIGAAWRDRALRARTQGLPEPTTPSEATRWGLCPSCLGRRVVYKVAEGRDGPCSSCGGSGKLADVFTGVGEPDG